VAVSSGPKTMTSLAVGSGKAGSDVVTTSYVAPSEYGSHGVLKSSKNSSTDSFCFVLDLTPIIRSTNCNGIRRTRLSDRKISAGLFSSSSRRIRPPVGPKMRIYCDVRRTRRLSNTLSLPESCHLRRQRVPIDPLVSSSDILQKFFVVTCRVLLGPAFGAVESHIVRMDVQQGHAPLFSDPVQFLSPDLNGRLTEKREQREVLWQSVGKFNVALPQGIGGGPDREDRSDTIRLGFERIGVEGGCIVLDVQCGNPFQVMEHRRGPA